VAFDLPPDLCGKLGTDSAERIYEIRATSERKIVSGGDGDSVDRRTPRGSYVADCGVASIADQANERRITNERRVNWCSKRGAYAARFDKRLIGLQKPAGPAGQLVGARRAGAGAIRGGSRTDRRAGGNKSNNGRRLKSKRLKLAAGCGASSGRQWTGPTRPLHRSVATATWKWNVVGHFVHDRLSLRRCQLIPFSAVTILIQLPQLALYNVLQKQ